MHLVHWFAYLSPVEGQAVPLTAVITVSQEAAAVTQLLPLFVYSKPLLISESVPTLTQTEPGYEVEHLELHETPLDEFTTQFVLGAGVWVGVGVLVGVGVFVGRGAPGVFVGAGVFVSAGVFVGNGVFVGAPGGRVGNGAEVGTDENVGQIPAAGVTTARPVRPLEQTT